MKKIIFLALFFFSILNAKTQTLLDTPPSEEFYPNLSTNVCNNSCLFELLATKLYLSFIAEFNDTNDKILLNIYTKLLNSITDFEKNLQNNAPSEAIKLAIIIPQKTIKSYSNTIINASLAYLLKQNANIKVKVFLIGTESKEAIAQVLEQIKFQNYKFAIAGFTLKGVSELANTELKIFVPTIHKSVANLNNENVYFGSIDYDEQIRVLLGENNKNVAIFSDNNTLSSMLNARIKAYANDTRTYQIVGEKLNFASLFRSQGSLNNSAIFFNTSLIKTALASSQLRVYNIRPRSLLSTQINFNPTFLSLTQPNDRKNFYLANSINNQDENIAYLNEIFNQNIDYNWIAYATSIGVDYFYTQFLNTEAPKIFEESLENNQVIYKVRLMKGGEAGFSEFNEE